MTTDLTTFDDGEAYAAGDEGASTMGSTWLHDLPTALAAAGMNYRVWPGWETRARSSGGFDGIRGVGIHHSASQTAADNDCRYIWDNAADRPIGNLFVDRDGQVTLGAAGASNTQGKGGPVTGSQGTITKDNGNRWMISVEAGNNGVGEAWPAAQVDALVQLCALLVSLYGLQPTDIWTHAGWCQPSTPGRKIDPAGPTPSHPQLGGTTGAATWDQAAFRALVAGGQYVPPCVPPPSEPWPVYDPPRNWGLFPLDAAKPTVRKGSQGSHVSYLQAVILHYAGGGIVVDGQFGTQTDRRVRDLQRFFGFPTAYVDGIVGYSPKAPQWATWPVVDMLVALNA